MKLVFLVSGNGGNLKFINTCIEKKIIKNVQIMVVGDRHCGAMDYAIKNNIEGYNVKYTRENNTELMDLLNKLNPDYVITNFHKIIDKDIVSKFYGKLINLHYSLLPSFAGLIGEQTILEAINNKCKFIGVTVHYVDYEVDKGEIIIQGITKNKGSNKEVINRVFQMGCLSLLNTIIIKDCSIISDVGVQDEILNNFSFNPELEFDTSEFNEIFWEELRVN